VCRKAAGRWLHSARFHQVPNRDTTHLRWFFWVGNWMAVFWRSTGWSLFAVLVTFPVSPAVFIASVRMYHGSPMEGLQSLDHVSLGSHKGWEKPQRCFAGQKRFFFLYVSCFTMKVKLLSKTFKFLKVDDGDWRLREGLALMCDLVSGFPQGPKAVWVKSFKEVAWRKACSGKDSWRQWRAREKLFNRIYGLISFLLHKTKAV